MIDFKYLIGTPFVDGGRDLSGFDCWGLVCYIFKYHYGRDLPDYKICCHDDVAVDNNINNNRKFWIKVDHPQEPCLVVMRFNSPFCNHTGTYIGDGRFIHTAERLGVKIDEMIHPYWKRHIEGFYVPNF